MQKDERSNGRSDISETLSSGPMMRELQRWSQMKPSQLVCPRWNQWANTLIERHRLITASRLPQTMIFARPAAMVEARDQYLSFSLNFYSRMNLAIQPILREIYFREERTARHKNALSDNSLSNTNSFTAQPLNSIIDNRSIQFQPAKFIDRKFDRERSNRSSAMPAGEDQIKTSRAATYSNNARGELPRGLSLVLRRMHRMDEFTCVHNKSNRIYENAERYALNLVKRSERIEQTLTNGAATVARQPSSAKTQQDKPQIVMTEHVAQHTPGMFRAQQMPELMVEQLTERVIRQIDQRAIAWRERMGKI